MGPARAKLILMAGARIQADEALAFGLVDAVVPGEELMGRAFALAEAAGGAAIKAMVR